MKYKTLVFLIFITCQFLGKAQENKASRLNLNGGYAFIKNGEADAALKFFRSALSIEANNPQVFYGLVSAFILKGQKDSAFHYLNITKEITPSLEILSTGELYYLHDDPRWAAYEKSLMEAIEKKYGYTFKDAGYVTQLLRMKVRDQAFYSEIKTAEKEIGKNSPVVLALWELKKKINKENQEQLVQLIQTKGWPKYSETGKEAANAAFFIIQHADVVLQKKYLPVIEQLAQQQEASSEAYAMMYDRIQMSDGKPQRYGSQIRYNPTTKKYELYKLENKEKVDGWREEKGMMPLKDYVAQWGIELE